jgi:Uncharacterized protein conserved in bacteria (DUF2252)
VSSRPCLAVPTGRARGPGVVAAAEAPGDLGHRYHRDAVALDGLAVGALDTRGCAETLGHTLQEHPTLALDAQAAWFCRTLHDSPSLAATAQAPLVLDHQSEDSQLVVFPRPSRGPNVDPRRSGGFLRGLPRPRDPLELLRAQDADRLPDLIPLRYQRMLASLFAFLRGTVVVMADDLASTPATGLRVQLCGDAHLSNFGVFASPERSLLFDINDLDETGSGPWEWDVKRPATSIAVAARVIGARPAARTEAAMTAVCSYRQRMGDYATWTSSTSGTRRSQPSRRC